ncbi:MAG TPA: hypothetical protein VFA21_19935 [Pyrinomonadaceae bacterium]|nr:hypothetical protein [Pyrinomonadaceae bacterium]
MAKDSQAARDAQAAAWREQIKELNSTESAQQKDTAQDEGAHAETQHSAGGGSQEKAQSQPPEPESARDFIARKMREEKNKGEL